MRTYLLVCLRMARRLLAVWVLIWCSAANARTSSSSVGCSPRWIVHPNFHAFGARRVNASTQQQCLDVCITNSSCVSVDWNDNAQCWMHDRRRKRYPYTGIIEYEIVRRCYRPNPTTSGMCLRVFSAFVTFE